MAPRSTTDARPHLATFVRLAHLPLLLVGANAAIIWAASADRHTAILAVVILALAWTFLAERACPADTTWNRDRGDTRRDLAYAVLNESLTALSLLALPLLASIMTVADVWPTAAPFAVQVVAALLVLDAGITLAHVASHRIGWLWRFHSVHHSVTRFYGLNGLMKHPIHQAIEMTAGIAPLLLIGIPEGVAVAVAGCVAIQLLVQHANIDYAVGPLDRWLAVNVGHRLHHRRQPGAGDVNFGLVTLLWDRMLGTYQAATTQPTVTTADLGVGGRPDYPARLLVQLAEPFRRLPTHE